MQHAVLIFEKKLQKCIRMGNPYSKFQFWDVYHQIYCQNHVLQLCGGISLDIQLKSSFMAICGLLGSLACKLAGFLPITSKQSGKQCGS